MPPFTPAVRALLIANGVAFLLQWLLGEAFTMHLALWPLGSAGLVAGGGFMPWQLLTSGFLHASIGHLFFNMLALWMFGAPLELVWGQKRFLTFYFVCLLGAALCQLVVASWLLREGQLATTIGASGGVFGVLLGFGMVFPEQRLVIFPIPVPIRARWAVVVFGAAELLFAWTGWQPGVAHFAHLGGLLFGWLLIRYWRGQPPFGRGGGRRPPLRSVR
ncbi:MAG: rhomboid family intramembrane serine protease [Pseudoxanthomonas sp.]